MASLAQVLQFGDYVESQKKAIETQNKNSRVTNELERNRIRPAIGLEDCQPCAILGVFVACYLDGTIRFLLLTSFYMLSLS